MHTDLPSLYSKHLNPDADAMSAWTSFSSQFLEQSTPTGLEAVVVDDSKMTGHTSKLANLRLRLGDLLSTSTRTAAALIGLGLSSLAPSLVVPLAVLQVLLFVRDVNRLQSIELTEPDVQLLLWLHELPSTWVEEKECVAKFGNGAAASLRRLEALGCLSADDGRWRVVEHVRLTGEPT